MREAIRILAKFYKQNHQTLTNQIWIVDHQKTKPIRRLQFHHITLMHFHRLFCGLSFRQPDRRNRPNPDDTFERQRPSRLSCETVSHRSAEASALPSSDRQSVLQGQRESLRVVRGGLPIIQKQTTE